MAITEALKVSQAKWRAKNIEAYNTYQREYNKRPKRIKKRREWELKNKKKLKEYRKKYYLIWYIENKEKKLEYNKRKCIIKEIEKL